ncbi:MAG: hypothetical protein GWN00_33970, partial [Aliifodinibius sp.]|nr:lamin tail domain-containing protein [Fodinibius sp.]NIV11608.1 hypothetical protein [Fodinibius sp.]NIY29615.1 hypothetical protein [Fodinibius sp.]
GNYSYEDDGWNIDPTPSPGDYNSTADVIFGDGTLFINEVYPDSSLPQPAFIELYNHSDQ